MFETYHLMRVSKTFAIDSYIKNGTSYKGHKYAIVLYPTIYQGTKLLP